MIYGTVKHVCFDETALVRVDGVEKSIWMKQDSLTKVTFGSGHVVSTIGENIRMGLPTSPQDYYPIR